MDSDPSPGELKGQAVSTSRWDLDLTAFWGLSPGRKMGDINNLTEYSSGPHQMYGWPRCALRTLILLRLQRVHVWAGHCRESYVTLLPTFLLTESSAVRTSPSKEGTIPFFETQAVRSGDQGLSGPGKLPSSPRGQLIPKDSQGGALTCPRSQSQGLLGPGLEPWFPDAQPSVQGCRPVLPKRQLVPESSGGLAKTRVAGPRPWSFRFCRPGWGL